MPSIYLDDAHGDPATSDTIRYYASILAVVHLNVPAHIHGDPPTYVPTDPSTVTMASYLNLFWFYQYQLAHALEGHANSQ